jgi:hypothetical protein
MSHSNNFAVILGAYFRGNPGVIEADEEKEPVPKLPTAYVVALSVVLLGIASAAWWAWFVSRGLSVAYEEGFREIRLPEE